MLKREDMALLLPASRYAASLAGRNPCQSALVSAPPPSTDLATPRRMARGALPLPRKRVSLRVAHDAPTPPALQVKVCLRCPRPRRVVPRISDSQRWLL